METLQMLKFWLKKDRLDFTKDWITPLKEMMVDDDDDDILARLFSTTNASTLDEVLGAIARTEGDKLADSTEVFK